MLLVLVAHLDDDREHTFMCKDGQCMFLEEGIAVLCAGVSYAYA